MLSSDGRVSIWSGTRGWKIDRTRLPTPNRNIDHSGCTKKKKIDINFHQAFPIRIVRLFEVHPQIDCNWEYCSLSPPLDMHILAQTASTQFASKIIICRHNRIRYIRVRAEAFSVRQWQCTLNMCGGFSATLLCIMLMLQATYSTLFGTMQIARVSIIIIIWQIYDDDDDVLAEIDAAYAECCYQRDHFCKVNFWWFPHRIFDRFLSSGRHVSLSSLALCMCARHSFRLHLRITAGGSLWNYHFIAFPQNYEFNLCESLRWHLTFNLQRNEKNNKHNRRSVNSTSKNRFELQAFSSSNDDLCFTFCRIMKNANGKPDDDIFRWLLAHASGHQRCFCYFIEFATTSGAMSSTTDDRIE